MKMIYDEDSANQVVFEERAYQTWLKDERNRILNLSNSIKKQEKWRQLFPQIEHDDDWLLDAKVF